MSFSVQGISYLSSQSVVSILPFKSQIDTNPVVFESRIESESHDSTVVGFTQNGPGHMT